MKITKRQLRRIIREQCALSQELEIADGGYVDLHSEEPKAENDKEVGMAINQLQAISVTALEVSEMVRELDYVPEWGDGKIATVLDRLNSIRSYLLGKSLGR
tara:strand:- start:543 stop:848 length:306 start_codon:yes stop_codon:yes gene_type:complete